MIGEPCAECGELPVIMELTIPAELSHTGKERKKRVDVDHCIVPLVKALNDGECQTVACCCGHGKRPGNIALADGRELIVCRSYEIAREVEDKFPPLFPERVDDD